MSDREEFAKACEASGCDNDDWHAHHCEGCGCCDTCCNCTASDCDCEACEDRRDE